MLRFKELISLIVFLVFMTMFVSFIGENLENYTEKRLPNGVLIPTTLTIEGHDYFFCPQPSGFYTLTHKGNCRGCCGNAEK